MIKNKALIFRNELKDRGLSVGLYRVNTGKNVQILTCQLIDNSFLNIIFHKKKKKVFIENFKSEMFSKEDIKLLIKEVFE